MAQVGSGLYQKFYCILLLPTCGGISQLLQSFSSSAPRLRRSPRRRFVYFDCVPRVLHVHHVMFTYDVDISWEPVNQRAPVRFTGRAPAKGTCARTCQLSFPATKKTTTFRATMQDFVTRAMECFLTDYAWGYVWVWVCVGTAKALQYIQQERPPNKKIEKKLLIQLTSIFRSISTRLLP